jgi:hypothetical protein
MKSYGNRNKQKLPQHEMNQLMSDACRVFLRITLIYLIWNHESWQDVLVERCQGRLLHEASGP